MKVIFIFLKRKIVRFENEVAIFEIVFRIFHEKPYNKFQKITHVPILLFKNHDENYFLIKKFSPIFIFIFIILFFEQNTKKSDEIFRNISFVDMKSSKIN